MKEKMHELLKTARKHGCEETYLDLFYSTLSHSLKYNESQQNETILSHAEWALEDALNRD